MRGSRGLMSGVGGRLRNGDVSGVVCAGGTWMHLLALWLELVDWHWFVTATYGFAS